MYDGQHLVVNSDEQTWALYYGGPKRISEQPLGKLSIQFSDLFRDGLDDNDDILREIAVEVAGHERGLASRIDDNGIIEDALNRLRDSLEFWRRYIVRDRLAAGAWNFDDRRSWRCGRRRRFGARLFSGGTSGQEKEKANEGSEN
jgi:hypothetical protein